MKLFADAASWIARNPGTVAVGCLCVTGVCAIGIGGLIYFGGGVAAISVGGTYYGAAIALGVVGGSTLVAGTAYGTISKGNRVERNRTEIIQQAAVAVQAVDRRERQVDAQLDGAMARIEVMEAKAEEDTRQITELKEDKNRWQIERNALQLEKQELIEQATGRELKYQEENRTLHIENEKLRLSQNSAGTFTGAVVRRSRAALAPMDIQAPENMKMS